MPFAAHAQQGDAGQTAGGLEEIVVTAQKRGQESIQSTPISITAFSSDDLQKRDISNLNDIAAFTPGVYLRTSKPGQTEVVIRGVTLGPGTKAATAGLYINDVSFELNGQNPDPDLYDLERVEVLKGPQGTLFGSSAMSGAVRYVTKRPELVGVSGQVVGDIATTSHGGESYSIKGVVNVPVVEDLFALRVMAYRNFNDGWIDNAYLGTKDINDDEQTGGRLSALLEPSSALSAHLMVQYQKMKVGETGRSQVGTSTFYGAGPERIEDFTTFILEEENSRDRFLLSSLELNWTVAPSTTLTAVSGFIDRRYTAQRPGQQGESLFKTYHVMVPNPVLDDDSKTRKFSQELRLTTQLGSIVDLTAGAYYSDGYRTSVSEFSGEGLDQIIFDLYGADPDEQGCRPEFPDSEFCGNDRVDDRQLAAYGQADFHPLPRVTLTAGLRWFKYEQTFHQEWGGYLNFGPTVKDQKFKESGVNPKFAASYEIDRELLVYASAAKGFRMGGVDGAIPFALCAQDLQDLDLSDYDGTFGADSVWTYELGAKSTLFDRRVSLDGAVFDTEWTNIQTDLLLPSCFYTITQNSAKQRIRGAEISARFAITPNLTLSLSGSHTDARLVGDALVGDDGDRAPFTPRYTATGMLDYAVPLSDKLDGFAQLSFSHHSRFRTEYDSVSTLPWIPAQTTVNLRFGVESGPLRATLYANNLTDETVVLGVSKHRFNDRKWTTGRPRTIGLQLQADF